MPIRNTLNCQGMKTVNVLFPEIEPYSTGELRVSDLHTIFYEEVGNATGRPALFLHGGPGVGILPGYRRFFDPDFYRVVLPDQRGAGRSKPAAEIRDNTTWDLINDLEKLREHLGIEDWIVMGGSWGSLLALCYAIEHPQSVSALILRGVFLGRSSEVDWLFKGEGTAQIFPDEWERFREPIKDRPASESISAYLALLTDDDEAVSLNAARAWSRWESSIMTLLPNPETVAEMTNDRSILSKARIECQYNHNAFFLKNDNHVLENVGDIADIPCHIVQGRYDVICPMLSAWELHKALPRSELKIVPDGSHSPMDESMATALIQVSEALKVK